MKNFERFVVYPLVLVFCICMFKSCSSGKIQISNVFVESDANDGSIANTITATLDGATFNASSGDLTADVDYEISGGEIPTGLTLTITITSQTTATLSLTGNATHHDFADSVDNISLTFKKAVITEGKDSEGLPIAIEFISPNKLNGVNSGGAAKVVTITGYRTSGVEDADIIYDDDLTTDCSSSWDPQGTLCDETLTTDSLSTSTKSNDSSGATWYANDADNKAATGVLIIDACNDGSCTSIDFNAARVFQMFSDGKTTHIRFAIHPELGNTPPDWDDTDWETISDWASVSAGTDFSGDALIVTDPTNVLLTPSTTRYLRIEVQNDGTLEGGSPNPDPWYNGYIELRNVKLFYVP